MKKTLFCLPRLFLFIWILTGCQKEHNRPELQPIIEKTTLESLKTFYNAQTSSALNINPSVSFNPYRGDLMWEKTFYSAEDRKYILPVEINKKEINYKISADKYLVIKDDKGKMTGSFYYVLNKSSLGESLQLNIILDAINIFDNNQENLSKAIAISKVGINSSQAVAEKSAVKNKGSFNFIGYKAKTSIAKDDTESGNGIDNNYVSPESCTANGGVLVEIEWWYQTYVNGVLVEEFYVYSTFECWGGSNGGGGGGGSSTPTPEMVAETALNAAAATVIKSLSLLDFTDEGDVISNGVIYKTRLYKHQYVKFGIGLTAKGYSIDRGVQKKVNSARPWVWHTLTHIGEGISGSATWPKNTNGTLSILTWDAIMGTYNSKMNLYWMVTLTYSGSINRNQYVDGNSILTFNLESTPEIGY